MENWKWTTLILCGFGLFKEFRPSEPFLNDYLIVFKEISLDDLVHVAYPVATYSYLGTLAIVFLVTDFFRYRPIIIIEGFAYVITWIVLIWGQGLTSFLFVEFLFGVTQSTEVAYYTYIYAKVDKNHYKKVTSYTYSSILVGRFLAAVASQLLTSFHIMDYHQLNYVTFSSLIIALSLSLMLPSVEDSIYFHRKTRHDIETRRNSNGENVVETSEKLPFSKQISHAIPVLWSHFKGAYTNVYVIKWSVWWGIAMAGHLQVYNYIQSLWTVISEEGGYDTSYNGAVEAIQCALSAALAFSVGFVSISWRKWSELSITLISSVMCVVLLWISQTHNLYYSYSGYIIFRILFQVNITIASAEISEQIQEDSHGLVFGVNTFVALCLQTVFTFVVVDQQGLALTERQQYFILGVIYGILGVGFLAFAIFTVLKHSYQSMHVTKQTPVQNYLYPAEDWYQTERTEWS